VSQAFFITGTDTEVGKTHTACALLYALRARGIRACGYKPIASGCQEQDGILRNEDVLALRMASGSIEGYEAHNVYSFLPPIAPHLAAAEAGVRIDPVLIGARYRALAARYDVVLVEGAGGWLLPIDERTTLADWVAEQCWPVVLVVAIRLGCINHALLSIESILRRAPLLGWVANVIQDSAQNLAIIDTLQQRIPAPRLATLPPGLPPRKAAPLLDLDLLLSRISIVQTN